MEKFKKKLMVIFGLGLIVLALTLGFQACGERYKFTSISSVVTSDSSRKCSVCGQPPTHAVVPTSNRSRALEYRCDEHKHSDAPGAEKMFFAILALFFGGAFLHAGLEKPK